MRKRCVVRGAQGITLFELLVVLAVLGLILGVSGLALGSLKSPRESEMWSSYVVHAPTQFIPAHRARRTAYGFYRMAALSAQTWMH